MDLICVIKTGEKIFIFLVLFLLLLISFLIFNYIFAGILNEIFEKVALQCRLYRLLLAFVTD